MGRAEVFFFTHLLSIDLETQKEQKSIYSVISIG